MSEELKKRPAVNEVVVFHETEFAKYAGTGVFHGYLGRAGGVSSGIYNSLNCGRGSQDEAEDVDQNRRIVSDTAGCKPENFLSLYQVHGDTCLIIDKPWSGDNRPEADAFVTDKAGIALGILTADCAPVLFVGKKSDGRSVIGAAHAGWGGALKGVLESTLAQMEFLGAQRETIVTSIGPCIGQDSYEVKRDFFDRFVQADPENACYFRNGDKSGFFMFDLAGYCKGRLKAAGVARTFSLDIDTCFNEEDFFSYRRATHRGEKDYGRQVSVIMIKS